MTTKNATGSNVIEAELMQKGEELVLAAPTFAVIETKEDADRLSMAMNAVRKYRDSLWEYFAPDIDKAHKLHKSLLAKFKAADEKPAELQESYTRLLKDFRRREEIRVRDEQARLDEEARQTALAQARLDGDNRTAKAIEDGKVRVAATQTAKPMAKIEGVTERETWRAEVENEDMLLRAVADGKAPREYVTPNMTALNAVVRATKGSIQIPGVRCVKDVVVGGRG